MPSGLTPFNEDQVSLGLGHAADFRVEQQSTPNNSVAVTGGNYLNRSTLQIEEIADANVSPFGTTTAGNERWDLVIVNAAGSLAILAGSNVALGSPTFSGMATLPAGATPIAAIYIDETATVEIENSDIFDVRAFFESTHHTPYSGVGSNNHDSTQVEHDKAVPSDWNSPTTPEDVDVLLDELASRGFIDQADTPASYAGQQYKVPTVDSLANDLVFLYRPSGVSVGSAAFQLEIDDASGGGIQTTNIDGLVSVDTRGNPPDDFKFKIPPKMLVFHLGIWNGDQFAAGSLDGVWRIIAFLDYNELNDLFYYTGYIEAMPISSGLVPVRLPVTAAKPGLFSGEVDDAGPWLVQSASNVSPSSGTQVSLIKFQDNIEILLTWKQDFPTTNNYTMNIELRSNDTAVWLLARFYRDLILPLLG